MGENLKATYTPLKIGLMGISFMFQAIQKPSAYPVNLCCGVISGYIWEEIVFLEELVKLREIRNIEDLVKF